MNRLSSVRLSEAISLMCRMLPISRAFLCTLGGRQDVLAVVLNIQVRMPSRDLNSRNADLAARVIPFYNSQMLDFRARHDMKLG
jgi:hypothetical protein